MGGLAAGGRGTGNGKRSGTRWIFLALAGLLVFSFPVPRSPFPVTSLEAQSDDGLQRMTRDVVPQVERAAGMRFRRPPVVLVRSREQVRQFLMRKIEMEYPPAELEASQRAYRAFRLIPDTLDLRRLMVDLYSEQVAGFYDPDSSALFVIRGADPTMVRLILAHELVHALQDQYTQLNSILKLKRQNDRQMAGQAVMEGQATLASLTAMAPGGQLPEMSRLWEAAREGIRQQQSSMPVFASAPLIIQEGLLFPYLAGSEFVQQFEQLRASPDELPFNTNLPVTTEQVLHISRYSRRERPVEITIAASAGDTTVYEDNFGEFDTRAALMTWGVPEADAVAAAGGWNGDRYRVLGSRQGTVAVWVTAWDTPDDAREFERLLRSSWERTTRGRAGRRSAVEALDVNGVKVVRLIDAPASWTGWNRLPGIRIAAAQR